MKLENQVCSLEQAKRLKELGVIQPDCLGYSALFFWAKPYPAPDSANWDLALSQNPGKVQNEFYAAFTVSELGLANGQLLTISDLQWSTNAAVAIATHLIHRLESGEITAAEVNARLAAD